MPPAGRPPRRRRPVRRVLRILLVVVLAWLVFLVAVPVYAWSQVGRVADTPAGSRPARQPGSLFLLVGSDSREGLSAAERKKLGTGNTAGQRTDTIMLLDVPPGGKPALISIPRDSYVSIPGNGKNKINAAFAFGGAPLLEQTVEQSTGLRVDGYVEVGFGGFVNVIDALGGIEMCLPKAIKDKNSHLNLKKGCQTLAGANALGYVRMRYADPEGDLGRVKRQRAMLSAMVAKAASPATVLNPVRYYRVTTSGIGSITLGKDTSAVEMATFVNGMRKVSGGHGLTLTVPVGNANLSTSVGSAVAWDEAKSAAMFADLARGDTADLAKYAK
ncbi:MAG: LCP family protein [Propionibacteriaceae bacterium]